MIAFLFLHGKGNKGGSRQQGQAKKNIRRLSFTFSSPAIVRSISRPSS